MSGSSDRAASGRVPVAVLLGGPSAEHDVSLVSGRAIGDALGGLGHPVEAWLITLDGAWWRLPAAAMDRGLPQAAYDQPAALGADGPLTSGAALARLAGSDPPPVVFVALHGPFGEDGTVQALCEAAGVAYTGSGVAASAIGMDKSLFKRFADGLGLPVVPWIDVTAAELSRDPDGTLGSLAAFSAVLPNAQLMVKPARLGSSVGLTIVEDPADRAELAAALRLAFSFDDRALAEAYLVHPRELEVAVVGNGPADVAVYGPGEIVPGHRFYDYDDKYRDGIARLLPRADVPPELRERLQEIARSAFLAIGAEGFARVDFLLDRDRLFLNEINTIPGFTPISMFPKVCADAGVDFATVCERIVELAMERASRRPPRRLDRADLP